ncbi:MAG: UbiA family prenyltransferase [Candidatus Thermoplasmatota archaeon]|jgi:4-hydroxybenzoate polyprenyltransferase|nr:UbiA family prenyltransferase [Candidatus Thermoplasmatota archaeon]
MNKIVAYAKLLRIPGLGALAIPPVIGALTVGVSDFFTLAILFGIGACSAMYGFILNDYADVELDSLVDDLYGKPLVSGDISKKTAVAICVFLSLIAFLLLFYLFRGKVLDDYKFFSLLCIVLAGILGSIYDLYGKKIAGSDFFVAISMAFLFLAGALAVGVPNVITWIIFILTFNQTLHMNVVEGGIKDADHDYKMGVKNIALYSGVRVENNAITIPFSFKMFGMGIRLFSACLLFIPFFIFGYNYYVWQLIILALATFGVLFFSIKLLSIKIFLRNKIQKYIGIQSFLRYSLVPIMLMSIINPLICVFLIIFPILWYIILTPLVGERLFRPRM